MAENRPNDETEPEIVMSCESSSYDEGGTDADD